MVVLGKFAQYDLRFIPQIVHHSLVGVFSCLAEPLLLRLVPQPIRERLLLVRSLLGAVDDVPQHIRRGNIRREKRLAVFLGKLYIPHIRRRVSPVIGKRDPCRPCPLAQLPRLVFAEIAPHILRYIELAALQIASDALVGLIDPRAVFRGGHNTSGLQQLVYKRVQRVASDLALRHHLSDVPVEYPLHVRAVRPVRAEQLHNVALRASYRPAPVLSVAQLREPSLRRLHPLHLVDIREVWVVPLRRLLVLLHPSLILAPELRGCAVVDPGHLHTRFAGRFFLTIPCIRVYNSIRRSLRPSGDPVVNGNPSFCVAGGFVLYVYVVSVLINNFVQIELVCSLISVYYSGYINGCVSQSYRSSNHVAVVPSSFPIQIRLDDVAFFDYFLYRCNAQHL